jgi:hypothetical protein
LPHQIANWPYGCCNGINVPARFFAVVFAMNQYCMFRQLAKVEVHSKNIPVEGCEENKVDYPAL